MASQLETLMLAQKKVLHEVSHEMRSPLARLQAAAGLAKQQPNKLDSSLSRIERECSNMNALLEELLTLSRLDAGIQVNLEEIVNMRSLLQEILEESTFDIEGKIPQFRMSAQANLMVKGNSRLLHRAIGNIVSNAIKHSPVDGSIFIDCGLLNDGSIALSISDQGTGVAEKELSSLFSPFFRGKSGRHLPGYGLGLAICENIIKIHGGSISARNVPSGGLCITIILLRVQYRSSTFK